MAELESLWREIMKYRAELLKQQSQKTENKQAVNPRVPWFMRPRLNTAKSEPLCQFVLRATEQHKTVTDSRTAG